MKLQVVLDLIAASTADAWVVLSPPTEEQMLAGGVQSRTHTSKAVLREDVRIEVAWGVPEFGPEPLGGFWASWSRFDNVEVHSFFAETLYGGRVVERRKFVYADGLRLVLPAPLPLMIDTSSEVRRWEIKRSDIPLARLLTEFTSLSKTPYDVDLATSGLVVIDE